MLQISPNRWALKPRQANAKFNAERIITELTHASVEGQPLEMHTQHSQVRSSNTGIPIVLETQQFTAGHG